MLSLAGAALLDYQAYEHQLGVKTVSWSRAGDLLAVGSYDNKVRLFCSRVWTVVACLEHPAALHELEPLTSRALIYQEEKEEAEDNYRNRPRIDESLLVGGTCFDKLFTSRTIRRFALNHQC